MTQLCTQCFTADGDFEVYTTPPGLNCCEVCKVRDDRYKGGPKVVDYVGDPRKIFSPNSDVSDP